MDVFSAQGRDPTSLWRLVGSVKRVYDKSLHGYVYSLEGGSSSTSSRMHLPKNDRAMCELVALSLTPPTTHSLSSMLYNIITQPGVIMGHFILLLMV